MCERGPHIDKKEILNLCEELYGPSSVNRLGNYWVEVEHQTPFAVCVQPENRDERLSAVLESQGLLGRQIDALFYIMDAEILAFTHFNETECLIAQIGKERHNNPTITSTIQNIVDPSSVEQSWVVESVSEWHQLVGEFILDRGSEELQMNDLIECQFNCLLSSDIQKSLVRWVLSGEADSIVDVADGNGGFIKEITEFNEERREGNIRSYVFRHSPNLIGLSGVILDYYFGPCWSGWAQNNFHNRVSNAEAERKNYSLKNFTGEDTQKQTGEEFDAVIGMPWMISYPNLPDRYREYAREVSDSRHLSLAELIAIESIKQLDTGGKAALVLPASIWRRGDFPEALREYGHTRAIIRSAELHLQESQLDSRFQLDVLLFEKESENMEDEPIKIINLESEVLPTEFDQLLHTSVENVSGKCWEELPLEIGFIEQDDLSKYPPEVLLSEPPLAELFHSNEFEKLKEFVEFRRGVQTGHNEFFYFDRSEMEEANIPKKFFTPLIKRIPTNESVYTITPDHIEYYTLDLREYIRSMPKDPDQLTEKEVLKSLKNDGYESLVKYIESTDERGARFHNIWFCPYQIEEVNSPDLVFSQIGDGRWFTVELEEFVVDQTNYTAHVNSPTDLEPLHAILNSKLYRKITTIFGQSRGGGYSRFGLHELESLPILTIIFDCNERDQLLSLFPPETRRDEYKLDREIIDFCESSTGHKLESLFEAEAEFAWAWFLHPHEYQEFRKMYESDPQQAEAFLAEKLEPEDVDEIMDLFSGYQLTEQRASILTEVVDEYNDGKYRIFLYGIAPQFEGVLLDWADKRGFETETRDNLPHIRIPADENYDEEYVPKRLNDLISTFLPGPFGAFLDDEIRKTRNKITHGEMIEISRQKATVFLLCLHTLCVQVIDDELGNSEV